MVIKFTFNQMLGQRIKQTGERVSLADISRETGISKNALSHMSKDAGISRINFDTLDALCKYFDCEPGDLLKRE